MYVYPYEALEGFTMALMMTSAVTYVAKISTPTTIASVNIIIVDREDDVCGDGVNNGDGDKGNEQ